MTHPGRVRKNNEDAFLALAFDANEVRYLGKTGEISLDECDCVFAVSDGMGGGASGEFASRIAVEKITKLLPRSFKLGASGIASGYAEILADLFGQIHKEMLLLGRVYEECRTMGATLTLAWVTPGWVYFAHLGDSRAYHLAHTGEFRQVSHDHTHVGWLFRQGRLNERQVRVHPRKNALQQALGAEQQIIDPHIGAVAVEPNDHFLLCTDGVVDCFWDRELAEFLSAPEVSDAQGGKAARLISSALQGVPRDNLTALTLHFHGVAS